MLGVASCNDLVHLAVGETAEAEITGWKPRHPTAIALRGGPEPETYQATYRWTDAVTGEARTGHAGYTPAELGRDGIPDSLKIDDGAGTNAIPKRHNQRPWFRPLLFLLATGAVVAVAAVAGAMATRSARGGR